MRDKNYRIENGLSVLGTLRRLIPERRCNFSEALRVAELQAAQLLELTGVEVEPVPSEVVTELPRITVRFVSIPTSGLSYWDTDSQHWIIGINRREPATRQRFTLLHEYKHVIDHGRVKNLYPGARGRTPEQQAEQAADYFAGCVLVPKRLLKRAWASGMQQPSQLARHFEVSEPAIAVRLAQVGLVDDQPRCRGTINYRRAARPLAASIKETA